MTHKTPIRVYYEDTDAGAFVYYANYLKFAERGRTELLRSVGLENKTLMDDQGIAFVVRHINADYLKPAFLDDLLDVHTRISKCKKASIVMKQSIYRHSSDDNKELLFGMDVTLACIDTNSGKPTRFPAHVQQSFENLMKESD